MFLANGLRRWLRDELQFSCPGSRRPTAPALRRSCPTLKIRRATGTDQRTSAVSTAGTKQVNVAVFDPNCNNDLKIRSELPALREAACFSSYVPFAETC